MTLHDPLAHQLDSIIATIVTKLESEKIILISPENIANQVNDFIDPENVSPALKTYASIMQIRQNTRAYLRKRHDPIDKMERQIEEGINDMFSDQLQDYYPVKRREEKAYIRREYMTTKEVESCVTRMRKAGAALLRHADAFEAWDATRKQATA